MFLKHYLDEDWSRLIELSSSERVRLKWYNYFSIRFAPVTIIRLSCYFHSKGYRILAKAFSALNFLIFNIEVPASLKIGPGLVIPHPQGTILGAREIGKNVTIFQQVTLGAKGADFGYDLTKRPVVGDGVTLAAGSKILGAIELGDGCIVGANAVVLDNIPAKATAVGVPARVIDFRLGD